MSRNLGTLTLDLVAEISEFRKGIDQATRIADNHARDMKRIMTDIDRRQNAALESATKGFKALAGVAASVAAVSTIRGVLDMADSYGQMSARIKLTIEDMNEYDYVQKRLLATANDAQRPLEEIQSIFIDTSGNLRDMGYSLERAMDIADSFSYALVRNATDAQKAAAALRSYDTALNKGIVDPRMWQSISSALPSLEISMSKIFDQPLQKIQEMGHNGKITVDMLNKAFLQSYDDNKSAAESMGATISGTFTAVQNQIKVYIGELNESAEITDKVSSSVAFLGDNIDTVAKTVGVAAVGGVTLYTSKLIAMSAVSMKTAASKIYLDFATRKHNLALIEEARLKEQKILADIRAIQANNSLSSSYSLLTAKTMDYHRTLAVTQRLQESTRSALGLVSASLGGPIGLISLAASAATAFYLFSGSAKDTRRDLVDLSEPLDQILEKFRELNDIQREDTILRYREKEEKAYREMLAARYKFLQAASKESSNQKGNFGLSHGHIREEFNQILLEAENTGKSMVSIINEQAKKFNLSDSAVGDLKTIAAVYDRQVLAHNRTKKVLEEVVGEHQKINEEAESLLSVVERMSEYDLNFIGPVRPDDEYVKELDKGLDAILKKRDEIIYKAKEEELIQSLLSGQLKDMNDISRARLAYEQKINDELQRNILNSENIVKMMGDLDEKVAKAGMSYKDAYIYDLEKMGATPKQIEDAKKSLDDLATKNDAIRLAKKSTVDVASEYKRIMESTLSDEERRGIELSKNLDILKQYGASEADMIAVRRAAFESMSVSMPGMGEGGDTLTAQLARIHENMTQLDTWREEQLAKLELAYGNEESALAESLARREEIEQDYRMRRSQFEGEMNQELLNLGINLSNDSLDALRQAGMESSGIYKAMFLANKASAFANAIISANEAEAKANAAYPDPIMGMSVGAMVKGIGLANAGVIAATGLKGMAHSGLDKVPETGTWLLEKGERVVTSNTSAKLDATLESLRSQNAEGGGETVVSNVYITLNGEGDVSSRNEEGGSQLGKLMEAATVKTMLKELKPGGILAKR